MRFGNATNDSIDSLRSVLERVIATIESIEPSKKHNAKRMLLQPGIITPERFSDEIRLNESLRVLLT